MAKSLETARNKEAHLAGLDDDALMSEWTEVAERAVRDKELLKAYSAEHQKRTRLAQLHLEPGDLALLQSMQAEGIESEEEVNG